jgi:hypothetical protein
MNTMKDHKSFWLPMVVLAVVFLLALGGCARGGNSSNTSGNQTTSGQTPGSTSTTTSGGSSVSDELNRLQQIDQQNQNDNNSLNTDDQNANQNNGSDQDTQPTASLNLTGAISVNTAAAPAAPVCTTLDCVQKFGDLRIQERVIALEKLKTDAQNNKNISDSVRTQVLGDVSSNEASLSAIKKQLDAETTIKSALADVKSIYALRIFAVILPRDYGEIELSHELYVIQRMTDAEPTIANLIQQDQAAGHDVSKLNTLFQDYKNKVGDATTNANAAQALIPSLTPANYPGTDQTLKTYHTDLKTARLDLQGAGNDLHQMYMILKADLGSLVPTPTPAS